MGIALIVHKVRRIILYCPVQQTVLPGRALLAHHLQTVLVLPEHVQIYGFNSLFLTLIVSGGEGVDLPRVFFYYRKKIHLTAVITF